MRKTKRGRPAKDGVKHPRALSRALAVLYSYDQARAGGQKYSVAVAESIAFVRQYQPGVPISESGIKRILAELRPKGAPTTLVSEFSVVEGEEARTLRHRLSVRGFLSEDEAGPASSQDDSKPLKRFRVRFASSPKYLRHNAKQSGS
jgi:hypothetical protein